MKASSLPTLDVWDDKLVALGSEIIDARVTLAEDLQAPLARAYEGIAGADHRPELSWMLSIHGADPEEGDDAEGEAEGTTAAQFRAALVQKRSA